MIRLRPTARPVAVALGAMTLALGAACAGSPSDDRATADRSPAPDGASLAFVTPLEETLSDGRYDDVRAVLVDVDGELLYERYNESSSAEYADVRGVTTSILSILVGVALDRGDLESLDQTVGELLPDHSDAMAPGVPDVTLRELLTMTSGLPTGDGPSRRGAADDKLMPPKAAGDPGVWALGAGLVRHPGSGFAYSAPAAHLLSPVLERATGRPVLELAREALFDPLGIDTAGAAEPVTGRKDFEKIYEKAGFAWPVDTNGHHRGDSHVKMTAAEMVKLGRLMLAGGAWEGRQLVSGTWVEESTREHVDVSDVYEAESGSYGYQWWVTTADGHPAFAAGGEGGQLIEVVPDLNLVVVVSTRVGDIQWAQPGVFMSMVDGFIAPALAG